MSIICNEAIDFADKLIGPEIEVRKYLADPMDEELTEHPGDVAVRDFQRKQRLMLAQYQNAGEDDPVPVDPKTAKVTDTALLNEERSEAEA